MSPGPAPVGGNRSGGMSGEARPLSSILSDIRRQEPGKVSDVERTEGPGGEENYRIKWLTPDGRVLIYNVDPQTGAVSGGGGNR
jgi:uncharacterized membrane protein YkoI